MRRYEDYSCWSRYLPLVSCMTKTLGRIIELEIISPDICCRNVQFEIKQLNITHTLGAAVFLLDLEQSNLSKTKYYSVWASKKTLSNFTFLVSTNAIRFHSYLRTPSGYHRKDKIFSTPIARKIPFANHVLLQNFQEMFSFLILRILALVIGSCDPVYDLTVKIIFGWVVQHVCM